MFINLYSCFMNGFGIILLFEQRNIVNFVYLTINVPFTDNGYDKVLPFPPLESY